MQYPQPMLGGFGPTCPQKGTSTLPTMVHSVISEMNSLVLLRALDTILHILSFI